MGANLHVASAEICASRIQPGNVACRVQGDRRVANGAELVHNLQVDMIECRLSKTKYNAETFHKINLNSYCKVLSA
jgi:hypothetical protein